MKILYYFKERDTMMYQWQRVHIFDELKRHDCNIEVFNPLVFDNIEEANEKLMQHIQNNHYDLFMTPHGSKDIYVQTLLKVKQKGIPTLLICFDNLIVPFDHSNIVKYFDLVWLTSIETNEMFNRWGANTIVLPYAANPYFFKPNYNDEIQRVAFIGTPYGSRVNMINLLLDNEVEVSLYSSNSKGPKIISEKMTIKDYIHPAYNLMRFSIGRRVILGALKQKINGNIELNKTSRFLEQHFPVDLKDLSTLYSNYAISLSSTAARNTGVLKHPVNIVNLRGFEIPMSGGLQMCLYFEELADYFEEDREIIFYRSNDELIEKARFYLQPQNKNIRMNMKLAARKRAENDHTWFCRFTNVFDHLGLDYKRVNK
ncbi:glycosyltransferase [Neobacillus sp. NPDC093127]|uniref:glycosyltransferase family protein n=1 Tax=Neobacillus sp. NPDC093127 TaxID=3364296 RepID=UPI00382E7B33